MYYRAVEITDGESSEPVSIVGVHPITWSRIADGPPSIGFVEADDTIDALVEACEAVRKEAAEIREWCASGKAVRFMVRRLIQTNAALIVDIIDAALAAARPQEASR